MRQDYYNIFELIKISKLNKWNVFNEIRRKSVNECLEWRKLLQISLARQRENLDWATQMKIIEITMWIERYCRPILQKHFEKLIIMRYPYFVQNPIKIKNLAKDKTEKTLRKFSY